MEMTSDEEDPHIVGVAPSSAASPAANIEAAVKLEGAEKPFVPLLILSALTVAFAHGANDVGNAVGPLAAVFEATLNGSIAGTPQMPIWVLAIGSAGFVVGIAALGSRTIATVGGKITTLTPSKSFSVQIGAAVAVLSSTSSALPSRPRTALLAQSSVLASPRRSRRREARSTAVCFSRSSSAGA